MSPEPSMSSIAEEQHMPAVEEERPTSSLPSLESPAKVVPLPSLVESSSEPLKVKGKGDDAFDDPDVEKAKRDTQKVGTAMLVGGKKSKPPSAPPPPGTPQKKPPPADAQKAIGTPVAQLVGQVVGGTAKKKPKEVTPQNKLAQKKKRTKQIGSGSVNSPVQILTSDYVTGLPVASKDLVDAYLIKHVKDKKKTSESGVETTTRKLVYKIDGKYTPEFKALMEATGQSADQLKAKLRREKKKPGSLIYFE